MSYTFVNQAKHPEAVCVSDIPSLISSQQITRPSVYAQTDTRVVINSAGSIVSGGSSNFFLNTSPNSFIKSGSVALNFDLVVNVAGGATGANSVGWGGGPIGMASALINRITVSCGQVTESLQNYAQIAEILTLNKTAPQYLTSEVAAMCGTNIGGGIIITAGTATQAVSLNCSIPILCGLFNSPDAYVPICLMSSQPQILVEWNSNLFQAFICVGGTTVTSYQVNNLVMIYNNVEVDASYVNELKMLMRERDFVYSFSAQNIISMTIGSSASISQEFGLDCQSLVGVKYTNWYSGATSFPTSNPYLCDTQTLANAYLDGRSLIQGIVLDCTKRPSAVYTVNRQSYNELFDPTCAYALAPSTVSAPLAVLNGGAINGAPYLNTCFTGGFPTQNYQEIGLGFSGSKCVKCRLEITKQNNSSGATFYVVFIRDCVYSIGKDGSLLQHM